MDAKRTAIVRILAGDPVGEFVHVGLAQEDGACSRQPLGHLAIGFRYETMENFRSRRGANAAREKIILQRNGYAVQRTPILAAEDLFFGQLRAAARRFGEDAEEGVHLGIPSLHSRERYIHEIDGRNFPAPQQRGRFAN
jgi:hypothetical protein